VVALGLALVFPDASARGALARFSERNASARAAAAFLAPLFALGWLVLSARIALGVLSSDLATPVAGALLALAVALLGALLSLVVVGVARVVPARWLAALPVGVGLAAGAVLAAALLSVAIVTGESSGSGGAFAIFGVLGREELDLRPVAYLLVVALGAALWPAPRRRGLVVAALVAALLPLAVTWHAAAAGLEDRRTALAVERSAPLASRLLAAYRKLTDGDRDGFSARFGGGDCDDGNPARSPGADDLPGNGLDEDCSGADARVAARVEPPPAAADQRKAARAAVPEKLNIVLLSVDTLRHDLGYMGHPRPISPRLDELARESVVFERAYALASYTSKSLPPILIGKYAGETRRDYAHFNRFGKEDTFLAERLQRAGIATRSVQGHWYFFQNYGMNRGFDVIDSAAAPKAAQAEGDKTSTSDKLSDAALATLAAPELADRPFFLWVHYTDPHAEYVRHEGFDFGPGSRGAYESEVAFVDHHVGRVLDALRKSPLWARTAVIVTSDHGEAFGEHGMIRHGFELWEELVRVPLLVRVPGVPPRRVAERRSLVDLVPTVLDLFGLPLPTGEGTDFTSGVSWLPDLAPSPGAALAKRPVFIDMVEGPHNAERRALIDGDLKIVTSGGRLLGLYDLAADPGEKSDLADDRQRASAALERFREFRGSLREFKVRAPR